MARLIDRDDALPKLVSASVWEIQVWSQGSAKWLVYVHTDSNVFKPRSELY